MNHCMVWSSMVWSLYTQAPTAHLPTDRLPYADPRTLCMYDWELATVDVPQHDLAEFLAFTLQPLTPLKTWLELVEFYRQHLLYYSAIQYPQEQ